MDRGAWIKFQKEGKKEDSKERTKVKNGMGMRNKMNIFVYHMLQSYGVQAGIYLKTEVKNEIHIPGLERVI